MHSFLRDVGREIRRSVAIVGVGLPFAVAYALARSQGRDTVAVTAGLLIIGLAVTEIVWRATDSATLSARASRARIESTALVLPYVGAAATQSGTVMFRWPAGMQSRNASPVVDHITFLAPNGVVFEIRMPALADLTRGQVTMTGASSRPPTGNATQTMLPTVDALRSLTAASAANEVSDGFLSRRSGLMVSQQAV